MTSSAAAVDVGELRNRLQSSNAFFMAMVDLVPPAFYFDKDVTQQLSEERSKQLLETCGGGGGGGGGGANKAGDMSDKARLRRARFDPAENVTVSELASRMVAAQAAAAGGADSRRRRAPPPPPEKTRLSLEDLRDKLRHRIDELRGKRHAVTADEFLEKRKLRRKESKVRLRIRKKAERESSGKQAKNEASKSSSAAGGGGAVVGAAAAAPAESKLAFSKFEFSSAASAARGRPKAGQKSFRDLLRKAEREQETLAQLKATDASKASEVEAKRLWTAAIDKAKGVKVRDDPALIKKSIKLQEKRKEKSRKEWQSRAESVEQRLQERQEKRQKNIQARKQSKKDNKVKRLKSKGRLISGF